MKNLLKLQLVHTVIFLMVVLPAQVGWVVTNDTKIQVNTGFYSENDMTLKSNSEMLVFGDVTINGSINNQAGVDGIVLLHGDASFINGTEDVDATFRLSEYSEEKWHLVSSPIENQDVFTLFENQAADWTLYMQEFDEATNQWSDWGTTQGETYQMSPMKGYSLWIEHPGTDPYVDATNMQGALNTGTVGSAGNLTKANLGWQATGNPYPSYIDLESTSGFTFSDVEQRAWFWIQDQGNYGVYDIVSNSGTGTLGVTNLVDPGQGFFIKVSSSPGTFTMDNSVRVHSDAGANFQKTTDLGTLRITAQNTNGSAYRDELVLVHNSESSTFFNPVYDAEKLYGYDSAPQLFSVKEKNLTIHSTPEITEETIFNLGFKCSEEGTYSLSFGDVNTFSSALTMWLEDKLTGSETKLNDQSTLSFNHSPGNDENRFLLKFKTDDNTNPMDEHSTIVNNGAVEVRFSGDTQGEISLTNMLGQKLVSSNFSGSTAELNVNLRPAVYILSVLTDKQSFSELIILK